MPEHRLWDVVIVTAVVKRDCCEGSRGCPLTIREVFFGIGRMTGHGVVCWE